MDRFVELPVLYLPTKIVRWCPAALTKLSIRVLLLNQTSFRFRIGGEL